ncbi:hypothetical protein LX32DRAFT_378776 [Colletotrichum zoysiae]|uniref:Uncharacterized protein n=1 Tax=Colletotrichum zoysiae TaxID=1216348 RepID=A0AAD9HJ20_9PEZI|nr:hypothetical protein LX32DRAFT_378776 [Colletotrichum zoysiae]
MPLALLECGRLPTRWALSRGGSKQGTGAYYVCTRIRFILTQPATSTHARGAPWRPKDHPSPYLLSQFSVSPHSETTRSLDSRVSKRSESSRHVGPPTKDSAPPPSDPITVANFHRRGVPSEGGSLWGSGRGFGLVWWQATPVFILLIPKVLCRCGTPCPGGTSLVAFLLGRSLPVAKN